MKKPHIYKTTNLLNGMYYYGVHNGYNVFNYLGSGRLLKEAIQKDGIENFKKEILMWFDTEDEAYEYERIIVNEKMINVNNPMCYNLCVGGKDTRQNKKDTEYLEGLAKLGFKGIQKQSLGSI